MSTTHPTMPAALAEVIATHRALFGGFTMMADEQQQTDPSDSGADAGEQKKDDAPLGEGGLKALQEERDARKELERQLNEFRRGMAELSGQKADSKTSVDDQLAALSNRIAELSSQTEVDALARRHGITDDKDLDLLRQTSGDARAVLAERLAPKPDEAEKKPQPKRRPDPDPSQGAKVEAKGAPLKGKQLLAATFEELDNTN